MVYLYEGRHQSNVYLEDSKVSGQGIEFQGAYEISKKQTPGRLERSLRGSDECTYRHN